VQKGQEDLLFFGGGGGGGGKINGEKRGGIYGGLVWSLKFLG